ncbi:sperm-associated antigen 6-like isoform X2 [Paramacrobiotus metropolitanus]|uniref:sperm-associated antigen 6-like isoform X2 n=1 Tax=Paramacrobiotus metropolitanus TaxID=2943436 RepID=UPI002445A59B|nr:sperm-associated antigen 6-like isoform X2 [Paramacrobiotus metropolitanus]
MNGRVLNQRQIAQVFEDYHRAQTTFVQTISELASRTKNIEYLQQEGVMALLRPLLLDMRPNIQYMAAMALGRLADNSPDLATGIITGDILPQVIYGLGKNGVIYKRAACFIMKSIAKHSAELAQAVVEGGGAAGLVTCLDAPEAALREQATEALGCIAKHTSDLAQSVVDAGAGPFLVFCLREPETSLKRAAVVTLGDICKHSADLAQTIVDTGAVPYLAKMIGADDVRLRIAQMVVNSGGIGATVEYLNTHRGPSRVPGLMTLGYLAAHSETIAAAIIVAKALPCLQATIKEPDEEDYVKAAAVWTIGQLAGHSSEHANTICTGDMLPQIMAFASDDLAASEDLRNKSRKTLRNLIDKCIYLPSLDMLLQHGPAVLKDAVITQYSKILPHDAKARRAFVVSGGLKYIQQLDVTKGSALYEAIEAVNACYPPDIVKYFSPGYAEQLLEKVDRFAPSKNEYEKYLQDPNLAAGREISADKSKIEMISGKS